jgi:hypothetical protein
MLAEFPPQTSNNIYHICIRILTKRRIVAFVLSIHLFVFATCHEPTIYRQGSILRFFSQPFPTLSSVEALTLLNAYGIADLANAMALRKPHYTDRTITLCIPCD